jgi:diguanylate cyclase (GGDEF)-like protein
VRWDSFAWDALKVMEQHEIERLLVTHDEIVVGIVTRETLRIFLSELLDPMTGLYRANYIQTIGENLIGKQCPFQLFFVDLDNFGEINKLYGHPVGDDIIQAFSVRLKSLTTDKDILCRYAGDEFVIITFRGDDEASHLLHSLSQEIMINDIFVSASVGLIDGNKESDFFINTFRDLVSKVSLMSTSSKKVRVS